MLGVLLGVQQQPLGRRDSIFERPMEPSHLASKLSKVGSERGVAGEKVDEKDGQKVGSTLISVSYLQ